MSIRPRAYACYSLLATPACSAHLRGGRARIAPAPPSAPRPNQITCSAVCSLPTLNRNAVAEASNSTTTSRMPAPARSAVRARENAASFFAGC